MKKIALISVFSAGLMSTAVAEQPQQLALADQTLLNAPGVDHDAVRQTVKKAQTVTLKVLDPVTKQHRWMDITVPQVRDEIWN